MIDHDIEDEGEVRSKRGWLPMSDDYYYYK